MQLIINGEARRFEGITTLADLVTALQMKGDRIAIELNQQIVSRAAWPETLLHEGDRLEIVHFVGGG
jgi:thiamine biosynthesis protein ThiS